MGVSVNAIAPGYIATDMNEALIKDEKRAESILSRIPAGRWGGARGFQGRGGLLGECGECVCQWRGVHC